MLFDLPCLTRGAERVGGSTVIDVRASETAVSPELQREVPGGWRSQSINNLYLYTIRIKATLRLWGRV